MMKNPRNLLAVSLVLFGIGIGFMFANAPSPVRAQFSAQGTFVPASNVGGSGNAVTLNVPNVNQLSDILGVPIYFLAQNNNVAGTTTVNVSSLGPESVFRLSAGNAVAIADHDFNTGILAEIIWTGGGFQQTNPATGNAPVGSEISVTNGAPNGYLIENGACISQTTYAALWAYFGSSDIWATQAGGSCSAGNFHLPFANGRTAVAYDQQGSVTAGVLTNAGSGCAATAVAIGCGSQNRTVAQNQLPNVTLGITGTQSFGVWITSGSSSPSTVGGSNLNASTITVQGSNFTTASINGGVTQQTLTTVQPTYTVLKAIKY